MSWATRRQFQYFSLFVIFVALVLFLFFYPIIFKKPTCNDGKKNGTETGVDCGGNCSLMCKDDVADPVVLWSRAFHLNNNFYNLVALVENQNKNSAIKNIEYEFKVYDTNNTIIGLVKGKTFIPPNQQFVVIEPRFDAGQSQIRSVSFDFIQSFTWVKKEPKLNTLPVVVDNIILNEEGNFPILNARVNNNSIYDLPEFEVIVVLYDENKNAINASKTYKSGLLSNAKDSIVFTWPEKFEIKPAIKDVFIQINPFSLPF